MPTPAPTKTTAQDRRLAGGLAEWAWRAALRLAMLKASGSYVIRLDVLDDGRRQLIIENPSTPYKIEDIGG